MIPDNGMHAFGRSPRNPRRHGMTLLEVIVAVAASGFLLLAARQVFEIVGSSTAAFARAVNESERRANGEDLLRELLHALDLSGVAASQGGEWPLEGDQREVRFDTRCDSAGGWKEPCQVVIRIGRDGPPSSSATGNDGDGMTLILQPRHGGSVTFSTGLDSITALLFLETAAGGGVWRDSWERNLPPPLAIGLVRPADTLIVRVGSGL